MPETETTKFVDVTDKFFDAVSRMEKGKVGVKSYFDMLEGARALEMGNPKLDTGLIHLSKEEIFFDACEGQSLPTVVAIMNKLLVLYLTWLEGLSLTVTVLSCRYMLEFLHNYKLCGVLKNSSFVNPRLHPADFLPPDDINSQLVNIVLRGFVVGLSKVIGFSLNVATSVLYDEEDLVTRSMSFDFLSQVSAQVASAEVDEAEFWLQQQDELKNDRFHALAIKQLKLIKALIHLEDVLSMDINLFEEDATRELPEKKETLEITNLLGDETFSAVPPFALSRFVQLDCDNKHLPSKNVEISQKDAYDTLANMIIDVDDMIQKLSTVKSAHQLQTYLKHEVGFSLATKANALTRGIFQLFFIRDDRSLVGLKENIMSITNRLLQETSMCGNSIMDPQLWNIQNTKSTEATKADCLKKMSQLLNDLEAASVHKLSTFGNNRCRQRQLNNKSIVLLDSLHFTAETTEAELFGYGVGDRLAPRLVEHPAFGICSFILHEKLDIMVDVALSGFEQDIYKLHEVPMVYWYVSTLCEETHRLITERLIPINQGKISAGRTLANKIKGTKAGPKKESLKAENARMKDFYIPILSENITYLEKCLSLFQLALSRATDGISTTISILRALYDTKEPLSLASEERLYSLRMKPWSSVGVPEMPSYKTYSQKNSGFRELQKMADKEKRSIMHKLIESTEAHLNKAIAFCEELCRNLENEKVLINRTRIGEVCALRTWVLNLRKTCDIYKAQLKLVKLDMEKPRSIRREKGYLPYFPIYKAS